jgi:hypothetical protein
MLDRVGARTIGVVMNKVRPSSGSHAYAYGYYASSSNGRAESDEAPISDSEPTAAPMKEKTS